MLKVGLTGGIGSGKSTVARIFESLGIPVYYADIEARRITNENRQVKAAIIERFGEEAYQNNMLNRVWMADKVFKDTYLLDCLNAIIHPAVINDAETWMQAQTAPYVIKEAALLFESGSAASLHKVIGVTAPVEIRISRVMAREHITRDAVLARMKNQIQEPIKMKLCDYVIHNNDQQSLIEQVLQLHSTLLHLSKPFKSQNYEST